MKITNMVCLIFTSLILLSIGADGQHFYAATLCKSGILTEKFNDLMKQIPDTITKEEALSIKMLNGICITKNGRMEVLKINEFQMTLFNKGDSVTIKQNSSTISTEMNDYLNKMQPGAKLYFEGIIGVFPDGKSLVFDYLPFIIR